jgi:hypothetical protein
MNRPAKYLKWTTRDLARLMAGYAMMSNDELELEFAPRSVHSIRGKAREMGLCRRGARAERNWLAVCERHKPIIFHGGRVA